MKKEYSLGSLFGAEFYVKTDEESYKRRREGLCKVGGRERGESNGGLAGRRADVEDIYW